MADLKITVELSLDEIRNLWFLLENTRQLIKEIGRNKPLELPIHSWSTSQGMCLERLRELEDVIEPIAEK